jgi:hypothetical protein
MTNRETYVLVNGILIGFAVGAAVLELLNKSERKSLLADLAKNVEEMELTKDAVSTFADLTNSGLHEEAYQGWIEFEKFFDTIKNF